MLAALPRTSAMTAESTSNTSANAPRPCSGTCWPALRRRTSSPAPHPRPTPGRCAVADRAGAGLCQLAKAQGACRRHRLCRTQPRLRSRRRSPQRALAVWQRHRPYPAPGRFQGSLPYFHRPAVHGPGTGTAGATVARPAQRLHQPRVRHARSRRGAAQCRGVRRPGAARRVPACRAVVRGGCL